MTVNYQIVLLGPGAAKYGDGLKRRLSKRVKELSTEARETIRFLSTKSIKRVSGALPTVAIYFGAKNHKNVDREELQRLLADSVTVIPIVPTIKNYSSQVPEELHPINGVGQDQPSGKTDAIANLVLENLGLLRRERRLFLSYRRDEAMQVAIQIRQALDGQGYDIFLDTHSVPKGDDFQEVLWQRVSDSEIMVVLDTPEFLESRWTQEEIARAEALTIGILQVIWPNQERANYSALCDPYYLTKENFDKGGQLTDDTINDLLDAVEKLRARSMAARHSNLVKEFRDAAESIDVKSTIQPERFILAEIDNKETIAVLPAVGVPDATGFHRASINSQGFASSVSSILLVYDHRGLRKSWSDYLDWLDEYLPVKAIRVMETAKRLKKNG